MNKPEEYQQLEDTTQETEREIKDRELKGSKVTGEDHTSAEMKKQELQYNEKHGWTHVEDLEKGKNTRGPEDSNHMPR